MKYKIPLAAALLFFSVGIFMSSYQILKEYGRITERFVPNLWVAAQAEIELLRFLDALNVHAHQGRTEGEGLTKRLYILWSRLPLLLQGAESTHVREVENAVETIQALDAELDRLEPLILELQRGDFAGYEAIHAAMNAFVVPIHQIVAATMLKDEAAAASHRNELRRIFWAILWCFVGIVVSAVILVVILFRALRNVSQLLREAEAASLVASAAEAQLKTVIDAVPAKINARDRCGRFIFRNKYDLELAAEEPLAAGPAADSPGALDELDRQVIETGQPVPFFEERAGGEEARSWLVTKVPVCATNGHAVHVVTVALDITLQKKTQERNAILAMAVEHAGDAIEITDAEGRFRYVNSAFERISGYSAADAIGRTPISLLMSDHRDEPTYRAVQQVIQSGQMWHGVLMARRKDGTLYQQETTISPVRDSSMDICLYVAVKRDITERLEAEARIWHLAHHDSLTNLPNRSLFQKCLRDALARARRDGTMVAVHFLDLDDFKDVNDTLGHAMGDQLLMAVTDRIKASTRETDTVARLGGDEFAVIQTGLATTHDAGELAQRLLETLAEPYLLDGNSLQVTACIGITVFPTDDEDPDQLLKFADMAMYRSKGMGGANYQFFQQAMNEAFQWRKLLENDLRTAILHNEMELYYQPLVDARDGKISCVEALLRWTHPERGPISPAEFIPVAEEGGLIVELGKWVLETACRQNKDWQDRGLPSVRIAVNLSAVQFLHHNLLASIHDALTGSRLDPRYLELEITEGVLMKDAEGAVATLRELAQSGIRIALDDFGTGYSSMGYLKRFPVHKIKIDRTFVTDIVTDQGDAAIVQAVVSLASGLGLSVTAEGVETLEQADRLRAIGCTELQGYFFGRPLPAPGIEARLREQAAGARQRRSRRELTAPV